MARTRGGRTTAGTRRTRASIATTIFLSAPSDIQPSSSTSVRHESSTSTQSSRKSVIQPSRSQTSSTSLTATPKSLTNLQSSRKSVIQQSRSQTSSTSVTATPKSSTSSQSSRNSVSESLSALRRRRGKTLTWKENDMISAISLIKSDPSMSVRKAAVMFSVPRSTLRDRLSGRVAVGAKPGRKPLLDSNLEEKLIDYASNRAKMGIGFGKAQFLQYAGSLAKKHKTSFMKGTPSNRWWRLVNRRHAGKIALRQPEGTASVRHQCMDTVKVAKYFAALKEVLSSSELLDKPERLWNMDETGLQLDVKPKKVVAKKGSKHLHSRTSGNRESLTIIACVNAAGQTVPPHVIVKGKTAKSLMGFNTEASPPGTNWSWSETGWTKQGLAKLWFTDTFLASIGPERPQLLVLDGHDSHNFLELIELAIENHIHIVEMPAHTSNWLQPCDRTLFKPLKDYYRSSAQELMSQFPGIITCRSNFTGLFATAWTKAMTHANISSGFQSCGIFPFDPSAIPIEAYLPNYLYTVEDIMANPGITDDQQRTFVDALDVAGKDDDQILPNVVDGFVAVTPLTPAEALEMFENELTTAQATTFNYIYSNGFQLSSDDAYMNWVTLKLMISTSDEVPKRKPETSAASAVVSAAVSTICSGVEVMESDNVIESDSQHLPCTAESEDVEQRVPPPSEAQETNISISPLSAAIESEAQDAVHVKYPPSHFPFKNTSYPGDGDDDVLPYPEPTLRKRKVNRSGQFKYFVLTSQEAHAAKLKYHQDKVQREKDKLQRKQQRDMSANKKQQEKAVKATIAQNRKLLKHANKRKSQKEPNRAKIQSAPSSQSQGGACTCCGKMYGADDDDKKEEEWLQCVGCGQWYHESCAEDCGILDDANFTCKNCA